MLIPDYQQLNMLNRLLFNDFKTLVFVREFPLSSPSKQVTI